MNRLSKINCIFLLLFFSNMMVSAQINVFSTNCISPTVTAFDNSTSFSKGCYVFPNTNGDIYGATGAKEVVAAEYILLEDDVEFSTTSSGQTDLRIEDAPFEVVAFTNDLNAIPKLEKLELGLTIPEFYNNAIVNFINEAGSPRLNPYLSDKIKVTAEFSYDLGNASNGLLPDSLHVTRHGFFTMDIDRDISGFDSLYFDPMANDTNYHIAQYPELGGNWTKTYSEYPFRVRFAPPRIGEWFCTIKIDLLNGTNVYESPQFSFNVIASNNPGYLQVGDNGNWLKRDGETFVPIGLNAPFVIRSGHPLYSNLGLIGGAAWYSETVPIAAYEQYMRYMDTLALNGVNYFRMIMNPWSLDIEYEQLGNYTDRLHMASEIDLILERAQANDMLIHWNLMVHYGLQTFPYSISDWDWSFDPAPGDPYGYGTNGYCYNDELNLASPIDFFADTTAIRYYKERIRYIMARWGYSPTVAMFEHFSEINQVGTEHGLGGATISGTNEYENNPVNQSKIFAWHAIMSDYIKNELQIPHLQTVSYTAGAIGDNDFSYGLQNIDVISSNEYNFFTSEVHGFYKKIISKVVNDFGNSYPLNGYNKPIIFSESGASDVWKCDNLVETRRNIWQNMFFGVAGAFDWNIEEIRADDPTKDYSIYSRVAEFFQGVDLEGDNWHSGIVKLDNNNNWEYKASYRNDCIREDELADLVYLRSGDKRKAFGVITNRRANYFTLGEGECVEDSLILAPKHSMHGETNFFGNLAWNGFSDTLQLYGSVQSDGGGNILKLNNMKSNLYSINYYSPHNLSSPIGAEIAIGPILNLDFPTMDTLDIMLFTAQRSNINFKSGFLDTVFTEETIQREDNNEQEDDVIVYPNPNDGQFVVMLEKTNDAQVILIKNSLGKLIDSRKEVFRENKYDVHGFAAGVYAVEVVYADKIVRKKMVIN